MVDPVPLALTFAQLAIAKGEEKQIIILVNFMIDL
jgi:hypothetical protein